MSVIANKNYYVGLGVIKGWFIFPIIFAVILFDNLKKDEKLPNKIFVALFASGVFVAAEGIYFWLSGLLTYDGRLRIFFDSPNQLAMFLAPVFLIGILKFGFEESRQLCCREGKVELWKLMGIMLGLILILFNLYLTKSYGAWLAIGLALIVVFWLKYRKKIGRRYAAMMIIFFLTIISAISYAKFENIKNLGSRSSLASRVMIWKSAGLMIEKNPVFGIGPGNFQNKYLKYQKYFPPYLEWAVPQPHNLYLAFWLESGLAGLAGFFWVIWLFFKDNKKTREHNLEAGLLCLAIILYFLVHGLVDTTYWRNDMAVVFWTVVVVNIYLADFSLDKSSNSNQKSKSENLKTTTQN
ncbi:MAG: O-antigen ligase family protein [Candidatus Moranbacteria bacterium]|nr:O-antigen ligase family protein [Candidatus Moranbacteria bacterium]